MEPRIQYAKTSDGVNIAFWTLGEAMPLVYMPEHPWSHIEIEWQIPEIRRWYERLARERLLVRYDSRGTGLSVRKVADCSLDALVRDLESVVDRLDLGRFALLAPFRTVPAAIAYVARHPERVSQLVLWRPWAQASDVVSRSPQVQAVLELMEKDWSLFVETSPRFIFGWAEGGVFTALIRESATEEAARAAIRAMLEFDVTALLPQVRSPTLVLHRRQMPYPDVETVSELVSQIPDARLTLLEGESGAPYLGDSEAVLAAIDEFLGEGEEAAAHLPSGTAIILFADIVDSTALTERLGDAAFRAKARELDGAMRAAIRKTGGSPVEGNLVGDGLLAVFTSARQAIESALRCGAAGESAGLPLHLGIHAGDVIREGNNVYGGAVNIASRISGLSAPGEVLVSDTVRGLARTSAGVSFEDRGEHELKGIAEPQRLFAVREQH